MMETRMVRETWRIRGCAIPQLAKSKRAFVCAYNDSLSAHIKDDRMQHNETKRWGGAYC